MKNTLRQDILKNLKTMDQDLKKEKDKKIYEKLFDSQAFKEASKVMIYMSFGTEIDTKPIIERAWADGKTVTIPHTQREGRLMYPAIITSFETLVPGDFGILCPDENRLELMDKEDLDLIIVPGVGFDKEGYRIGYGGGYYDRFLDSLDVPTLSILYEDQLLERVPREEHDLPVQTLITEEKVYNI